jgi:hypothetical protein
VGHPNITYVPPVVMLHATVDFAQESHRAGRRGGALNPVTIVKVKRAGRSEDAVHMYWKV